MLFASLCNFYTHIYLHIDLLLGGVGFILYILINIVKCDWNMNTEGGLFSEWCMQYVSFFLTISADFYLIFEM